MFGTRAALLVVLAAVLVPRAQAAPVTVTGHIADAQGKPVAKALVTLAPPRSGFAARQAALSPAPPPEPAAQAATDAGGRFRLAAPAEGMWVLGVEAPGFVAAEVGLFPLLEEREVDEVRLEKNEPVSVRVLGPDGKPRPGATVRARVEEASFLAVLRGDTGAGPRWGTADATGTVLLPKAAAETLQVSAFLPGLLPGAAVQVESARAVELRLEAGCPRRLEARDGKGEPVAGALVSLGDQALGATDPTGAFPAALPCKGSARVRAETAQGLSGEISAEPVPPGAAAPPLRLVLVPPLRFAGRVLDAGSRAPLAGAFVWPSDDPAAFAMSDAKGAYVVTRSRLPVTGFRLHGAAREHRPDRQAAAPPAGNGGIAAVAAGPTLTLQPVVTLAGQVVDARGKPVAGAAVVAAEPEQDGTGPGGRMRFVIRRFEGGGETSFRTRTDAAGAFRLEVLPRRIYTLRATHADFAPGSLDVTEKLEPGSSRRGLKVVLHAGLSAFGQVASAAGPPVAGAEIELVAAKAGPALPFLALLGGEDKVDKITATSDGEGRFRFDHLPAGRFDLKARAEGFAPLTVRGIALAAQGAPADLGTMTLAPGATLTGFVADGRGKPVAGAAVSLASPNPAAVMVFGRRSRMGRGGGADDREVRTQADGSFSFRNLTPGEELGVSARGKGFLTATAARVKVPPAEPVRLVLQPAARLSGRVVDDQGSPVAEASVSVRSAEGERFADFSNLFADTDAQGNFTFETLEPGKVGVSAGAQGYLRSDARYVEISPAREVTGVELALKRGAVIEGLVTTSAGAPAAGAQVSLQQAMSFEAGIPAEPITTRTDGDGHYRLAGVPEGARSVAAELSGHLRAVRDLEVRPGSNRLDLRLGEGLHVAGRVVDPGGNPVAGAQVALSAPRRAGDGDEITGTDGAFRFTGLAAGSYSLGASKQGFQPAEQAVQLAESPVEGVELRLTRGGSAIVGRVLGLDFAQLSGVQINAFARGSAVGGDSFRSGQLDFEGQYRIDSVTPGEWSVTAALADGGRSVRKNVTVPEGGGDVQLDLPFESGLTLSGRVTRGGDAIAGATVSAFGVGLESSATGATDAAGAFRLEGLKAGQYRIMVMQLERGLQHQQTVDLETSREIEIELPSARVSGRVIDATSSAPLAGVVVRAEKTGDTQPSFFGPRATSDNTGSFTLSNLSAGSYRMLASKDGYARAEKPVEVASDEASVVGLELALEPEAGLVLDVTTALGGAPPSFWIALLNGAGQAMLSRLVEPGENGRTRVENAPAGSFRVLVAAQGFATVSLPVSIPGDPVPVRLPLAAKLTVAVRELLGTEQQGATGATLTLVGADGQPFRSVRFTSVITERPLSAGTVEVDDLPAGTWQIRVAGPAGKTWEDTVTVREGETARKEL